MRIASLKELYLDELGGLYDAEMQTILTLPRLKDVVRRAYGCARAYAEQLSRHDEARLLQETIDEESRANRRLAEIAYTSSPS